MNKGIKEYYDLTDYSMKDAVTKIMKDIPEVTAQEIADCLGGSVSTIRVYMSLNRNGKLYHTEQEKKAVRQYKKVWYQANRARLDKKRDANKEARREYDKAYYKSEEGREKIRIYQEANKKEIVKLKQDWYTARTLPYNVIYCIPNYDGLGGNYCGVTNSPKFRMINHSNTGKLNTDDWFILDIKVDRAEAEASESAFHSQGYHGDIVETRRRNASQ